MDGEAMDRPPARREGTPPRAFEDVFKIAFWGLLIALTVRTLLFQPFHIESDSMQPNLMAGDYVVASKWSYGWSRFSVPLSPEILGEGRVWPREPSRGDVVVFRAPNSGSQDYVKRVVGMPGDLVGMSEGHLRLNSEPVPHRLLGERTAGDDAGRVLRYQVYEETLPGGARHQILVSGGGILDETQMFQVPEGHYFMLGDNRSESLDSRVPPPLGPGMVPARNIIGRAERVMVSVTPEFSILRPWTWGHVRADRTFAPVEDRP
jgi:signal peptidase I